jgi:RimJ/RimL family protein N-acetyltransferase
MTELVVREAVESDGAAIGEAHAASWLAAYGHILPADFLPSAAESRRTGWPGMIRNVLEPPNVLFVGERRGRVVAFAHAEPVPGADTAEITGFYSHPDAWGSGLADALMTRTERTLARDFHHVRLWTFRDSARARRFYEKIGFRLTGNARDETISNWASGATVDCPAVEYATLLAG